MTDGFVQQDSRPARAEHHFHFASRSLASVELQNRLPRRFIGEMLRRFFGQEELERDASAAACTCRAPNSALSDFAMQKTLMRAIGCTSSAKVPSEPMTRMRRSSSA